MSEALEYKRKDFVSDIDPKWCPGCGCFPILKSVTDAFTDIGVKREDLAVISGIGCSSRFPYYVDTYGFHTIHGRAPTVAMGLKTARPDLSVWVVSGDGDCLSIGGNHFIHTMRRNPDINYLLFNNQIYGLTKGQASPASQVGTVSKTTPFGSTDTPMQALPMALAAGATFAARVLDADVKGMREIFKKAQEHKGVSFVEIFFNCVTFADKVFDSWANKKTRAENTILLEPGQPMIYGVDKERALVLDGLKIKSVLVADVDEKDILVHDATDSTMNYLLSQLRDPLPIGVLRSVEAPSFGDIVQRQAEDVTQKLGFGNLDDLLKGPDSWVVE